jgi:DNA processing protein
MLEPMTARATARTATVNGAGRRRRTRPALDLDAMDLETTQVLDAMPGRGGMGSTRIAQRAGMAPSTVVRCLAALAAAGFIERCEEGWRLSRA